MSPLAVFALCVQACLIQSALSSPSPIYSNFGSCGVNRLSTALAPAVSLGARGGCGAAYGGAGAGQVGVAGAVTACGNTVVAGAVPAAGSASFGGVVPASGCVSIAGQCGCGCGC